ncbi:hypothetical protein Tco_0257863 [Tanacetum coccineum]
MQTQTSSVLHNDTVSSCSTSKVQEKTQLSRSRCMNSLREVKSQFKFLSETLQDFGTIPIFKRTFSQDLDLLEQHLTKDILSHTDCNTTLTKLITKFENAFNSEFKEHMQKYTRFNAQSFQDAMIFQELNVDSLKVDLVVIQNTCSEKEDSNSETASNKSVKESSLDSATKDVHAIKYKMSKAKERCMTYFRSLHSHLQVLSKEDLKGTRIEHGFKRAFMSVFGQDNDTFTSTMFLNVDQLQKQLDKDDFQENGSMAAFWVINRQFQKFIDLKFTLDYDSQMSDKYFAEYTRIEVKQFRETLLQHKSNVKKFVAERIRHQRHSRTESEVQDDSSRPGNDTDADDADIRPIYDEEPMTEIQEKVFAIDALQNDLRKLKGNSVDTTKFAKTSVLGKPVLQSLRNQLVVRQPNAFKSERPQMSKQRNSSKNMSRFSSNDMVHNHYLDEARKKTQERDRNSKTSVMPSARFRSTVDGSKPKRRSTNHSTRSLLISKSSCVMITAVPIADHSKNSNSFSDSKHFVCSTCHKCVFNVNHDASITKLMKEVNSRVKIQSHKTRNSNKPVDQKSHTQKPGGQIFTGHRFSPNKHLSNIV